MSLVSMKKMKMLQKTNTSGQKNKEKMFNLIWINKVQNSTLRSYFLGERQTITFTLGNVSTEMLILTISKNIINHWNFDSIFKPFQFSLVCKSTIRQ
jgi:hypothetical protein